jgi:hypothetical protein
MAPGGLVSLYVVLERGPEAHQDLGGHLEQSLGLRGIPHQRDVTTSHSPDSLNSCIEY